MKVREADRELVGCGVSPHPLEDVVDLSVGTNTIASWKCTDLLPLEKAAPEKTHQTAPPPQRTRPRRDIVRRGGREALQDSNL